MTTALAILNVLQFVLLIWVLTRHGHLIKAHVDLLKASQELGQSYADFRRQFEAYRAKYDPLPPMPNMQRNFAVIKGDKDARPAED